jgi:hypothetical protein
MSRKIRHIYTAFASHSNPRPCLTSTFRFAIRARCKAPGLAAGRFSVQEPVGCSGNLYYHGAGNQLP